MAGFSILPIRREAKARGVPWPAVQEAYWLIKTGAWEKRQRPNEVRQNAWMMANGSTPGNWPFWRHGFAARWGEKVDRHDFTVVPGYDEIGQQIGTAFGEYTGDDGTERLFEFLFSIYDKMPSRTELYRDALDVAETWSRQREEVPF